MKEQLEIEFKILINKEIYERIIKDFKDYFVDHYQQTNYYLTHPLLKQKQYMLRIREKNNKFELTLKRPYLQHQIETNIIIDENIKDKIIHHQFVDNEIMDILKAEGISPQELLQQFSLITDRHDFQLEAGILSLDYNQYLNKEDYELEFEVNNEINGYQIFLDIIKSYQLTYQKNCPSKIKRVLDSL